MEVVGRADAPPFARLEEQTQPSISDKSSGRKRPRRHHVLLHTPSTERAAKSCQGLRRYARCPHRFLRTVASAPVVDADDARPTRRQTSDCLIENIVLPWLKQGP